MLRRSLLTALVVGTILTAINQGPTILSGDLPGSLAWKIPLTYCVPFCVATWGALVNSRRSSAPRRAVTAPRQQSRGEDEAEPGE